MEAEFWVEFGLACGGGRVGGVGRAGMGYIHSVGVRLIRCMEESDRTHERIEGWTHTPDGVRHHG